MSDHSLHEKARVLIKFGSLNAENGLVVKLRFLHIPRMAVNFVNTRHGWNSSTDEMRVHKIIVFVSLKTPLNVSPDG